MSLEFPIQQVRSQFPALRTGSALMDGAGGTQMPLSVADAIRDGALSSVAQRGTQNHLSANADRTVRAAREAMADFVNADPRGIVFGRSATQLTFDIATAFAKLLSPGDEIVVSRLDHDANVAPWLLAAELSGATVRWIDFDPGTAELTVEHAAGAIGPATRLVALTAASNLFGSCPDIAAISELVHEHGAMFYVDAVAYAPHRLVDFEALGADLLVCSPYKFCGPHIGVLASRPEILEQLHPNKLRPSTEEVPERFELGTLPYELLAGVTAAVEFLAGVIPSSGTRREQLVRSYEGLHAHEQALVERLRDGLAGIEGVHRIAVAGRTLPSVLFSIDGISPLEASARLGEQNVVIGGGLFYAYEAGLHAGLGEGGLRASMAPYTSLDDIDRVLREVGALARFASSHDA